MNPVFCEVRQTIILYYEVFERNDIGETTTTHFLKNVRCLSSKCFSSNYTKLNMNFKVKETWRNLLVMISTRQKKFKMKSILLFLLPFRINFIGIMLYFEIIFIVFPVFFSPLFTEDVQTWKFCHNDLAAAKLSFEKCV